MTHKGWSAAELTRLGDRVAEDYRGALSDHQRRMQRFRDYYRRWRNRVEPPRAGEEDVANFQVPVTQWNVFIKWAKTMQSLLGDDAEIVAQPTGPADQKLVHKVGRFATARYLHQIDCAITKYATFTFRAILFGRSFAYRPWVRDTYEVLQPDGTVREEVWYEGPGFYPLWPDDLIVPAEDVDNIQEFSFVIRKCYLTPQQLLDGERDGRYFGIADDFQNIVNFGAQKRERDTEHAQADEVKAEKDEAEGVLFEGSESRRQALLVLEWYGRWRPLKKGKDGAENDLSAREMGEVEYVVRYLPDLNKVIGIERLVDLYPRMKNRRPFAELALCHDGSYWSPGFGELLYTIEDEASANHNLFTEALEWSVGPVVIARPGAGIKKQLERIGPRSVLWSEDPQAINTLRFAADLNGPAMKEQAVLGYSEKVLGINDQTAGRSFDRPNAPRTASGQLALIEQADIRAYLDVMFFREDFQRILFDFWMLDSTFAPPEVFFRVTEEEAQGLFAVSRGGAVMTAEELGGRFDFRIKFATSVWSREQRKQDQLALYQLDLQNPLIVQNPRALWVVTQKVHRALGDDNFNDIIPEPADLDQPTPPREEWTLMLQGEDVTVHPMDNDDLHLVDHYRRIEEHKASSRPDVDALNRMAQHIVEHQAQKRQKMLMQALTQTMVNTLASNTADPSLGGLNARGPIPMSIQQLREQLGTLTGGQGGNGTA